MHLIQILLPVYDNHGKRFPAAYHQQVKNELSGRFLGLTAYIHAPAEGIWTRGKATQREDILVYEVMTTALNRKWWRQYRASLEKLFCQESIVIRAHNIRRL